MDMRLYAALVSEESDLPELQSEKGLGKALKQIERLETMVAEAWEIIKIQRQAHPVVNWQAVFVAPEYFFSNQRYVQDRFFSHDVKQTIISRLAALAKKYPDFLIVPGTVLWTKELFDKKFTLLGRGQSQTQKVLNTKRQQKAAARIMSASANFGTRTNSKDWSHTQDIQTENRKLAQNVAYLCLGNKILKYHKVGNYKEVEGETDDLLFVPGSIVGRFNVGGVKYGLEICMDHAMGVFDSTVNGASDRVHVQIIVSSFVACPTNVNASVTLHSSTEPAGLIPTGPGKATTTGTNPVRFGGDKVGKLVREPIKSGSFKVWVIDLSAGDLTAPWDHKLTSNNLQEVAHVG